MIVTGLRTVLLPGLGCLISCFGIWVWEGCWELDTYHRCMHVAWAGLFDLLGWVVRKRVLMGLGCLISCFGVQVLGAW
jgi:hypothetical protein